MIDLGGIAQAAGGILGGFGGSGDNGLDGIKGLMDQSFGQAMEMTQLQMQQQMRMDLVKGLSSAAQSHDQTTNQIFQAIGQ